MPAAPIRFFFDFLSPYSYLASTQIEALAARHGRTLDARPVLLAAVLGARGAKGPAEEPARRAWTFKHVWRLAHATGVPIRLPPAHPFNPLPALRAVVLLEGDERRRAMAALWAATWQTGAGVVGAPAVAAALGAAGGDGDRLAAAAQSDAAKAAVRANTDEMVGAGGFGVPSMVADGELFFGFDAFGMLETFLRGEDPLPRRFLDVMKDLPASAQRKGV
jgi:2-hydroxychromene-2-carboxylate isomerase